MSAMNLLVAVSVCGLRLRNQRGEDGWGRRHASNESAFDRFRSRLSTAQTQGEAGGGGRGVTKCAIVDLSDQTKGRILIVGVTNTEHCTE